MAGGALTPIAPAAAQLYILRAAAPDASAALFIFTAATAGTGNSRISSDLLDKTKPLRKAEKNELTDELIQEVIKNDSKLWIENASDEVNAFISSKNTKITAKGSAIKHTLEKHGKNSINAKSLRLIPQA